MPVSALSRPACVTPRSSAAASTAAAQLGANRIAAPAPLPLAPPSPLPAAPLPAAPLPPPLPLLPPPPLPPAPLLPPALPPPLPPAPPPLSSKRTSPRCRSPASVLHTPACARAEMPIVSMASAVTARAATSSVPGHGVPESTVKVAAPGAGGRRSAARSSGVAPASSW